MISVQAPVIETCFMSIDEIARIFSNCQSPYIGREIGIFSSPRAYVVGSRQEFFPSPKPCIEGQKSEFFPSPRVNIKGQRSEFFTILRKVRGQVLRSKIVGMAVRYVMIRSNCVLFHVKRTLNGQISFQKADVSTLTSAYYLFLQSSTPRASSRRHDSACYQRTCVRKLQSVFRNFDRRP